MKTENGVTLVIGSGGIKCAAAIGMWRILQEEGIVVNSIVGCSGGSMYGALIANGESVDTMQEQSKVLWTSDTMQGYTANLKASKDGSLKFNERSGLVDDDEIDQFVSHVDRGETGDRLTRLDLIGNVVDGIVVGAVENGGQVHTDQVVPIGEL